MPEFNLQRIITIGTSSGGIEALSRLLSRLPADFPVPLCIVLHIHPHSPSIRKRRRRAWPTSRRPTSTCCYKTV